MSTSKIARPSASASGQQDQKKIYLDWANHYLRKSGQADIVLSDLKDISNGIYLPKIIKAVVPGEIPAVQESPDSADAKLGNIDQCIKYLQGVGVNCKSVKPQDIADGNMRAILSLFYNLSQFKKTSKPTQNSSDIPQQSKRAQSPGLKASHGVSTDKSAALKSPTSVSLPANGALSPGIGRRTAGSSILTSTTYDRPYSQRRIPYKSVTLEQEKLSQDVDKDQCPLTESLEKSNGDLSSSSELEKSGSDSQPLRSQSDSQTTSEAQRPRLTKKSGSFAFSKDSKLQPHASKAENGQTRAKTLPQASKLQAPGSNKKPEEEAPVVSEDNEVSRPQSRLKFPGGGARAKSPAPNTGRMISRPSSRLSKMTSSEESSGPAPTESKLKLVRKGSDGAVKRNRVNHSISSVPGVGVIETGSSHSNTQTPNSNSTSEPQTSIPSHGKSKIGTPEMSRKKLVSDSANEPANEGGNTKVTPGLRKPGGLKKPGGFGFSRTPKSQDNEATNEGAESNVPPTTASVERKTSFSKLNRFGMGKLVKSAHNSSHSVNGSNSSLDSTDIKVAVSAKLDSQEKPAQLELAVTEGSTGSSQNSPTSDLKLTPSDSGTSDHPRFGRRISPEGMSHDDATSPRDLSQVESEVDELNRKNEELKSDSNSTKPGSNTKRNKKLSQPETGQTESLESPQLHQKPTSPLVQDSRGLPQAHNEPGTIIVESPVHSPTNSKPRARSLSPKSSHRVIRTRTPTNFEGRSPFDANRSGSSEDLQRIKSPLKSSLRGGNKRHSSSGSSNSSASNSPARAKVVISPRSSQIVYNPGESVANGSHSNEAITKMEDRPISFADSLSTSSSSGTYHSQILPTGGSLHNSVRSTLSERLDYQDEVEFLERGMPLKNDKPSSNPELELIGTFENQLSTMKEDLATKERMLSMYETSMADLSSKVHYLKKTLDEKDREIRQLTDEKATVISQNQSHWFDLDSRSLASRAEVLSDGYLSDPSMENAKGEKKKKKWKLFKKGSKKESKEHLSPSMDTESIISGRSNTRLRRTLSAKRKTPDLMSISEYAGPRYKDLDTKSTYTMDTRSEFGGAPLPMVWAEENINVYSDESPGAVVSVFLVPESSEDPVIRNDSGFYSSSSLSRHSSDSSGLNKGDSVEGLENSGLALGSLSVAPETSWVTMDTKIGNIFMHHLNAIDQEGYLGLNEDSIYCYIIGEQRRAIGNALLPSQTPYQAIAECAQIRILMKGSSQESCDSLAYKSLMNSDALTSYMNMLQDTHWLVVMGTKGTCKTGLATGLAKHLSLCLTEGEDGAGSGGEIVSFSLDKEGIQSPLNYLKNDLMKRTQLPIAPPVLLLEDIYECSQLEQLLVATGGLNKRPFIIATLCSSGTTKGIPLHQLLFHHQIRVVTCNPSTEPVLGILARSLRKQIYQFKATTRDLELVSEKLVNWLPYLLDHLNQFINKFHSNVVNLGPRVFMGCPLNQAPNELETWFLNLWNYFIIPYLMGTIMAGIETYTADPHMIWTDVREWVAETYPWQPSINIGKLRTLNPEDVGWNHAVRPQQNRLMILKDEDTRSLLHA